MPPYLRQSGRRNGYQQLKLPAWVTYVPCHAHCPCCHIEVKVGELFLSKWLKTVCVGFLLVTIRYMWIAQITRFFLMKAAAAVSTRRSSKSKRFFSTVSLVWQSRSDDAYFVCSLTPFFPLLVQNLKDSNRAIELCGFKNTIAQCFGRVVALHFLPL